jgi:hypothetical protein
MQVSILEEEGEDSESERANSEVLVEPDFKFVDSTASVIGEERTGNLKTAIANFVVLPSFVIGHSLHQHIKLPLIKNFKVASRVEKKLTKR